MESALRQTGALRPVMTRHERASRLLSGALVAALLVLLGGALAVPGRVAAAAQDDAAYPTAALAPEDALVYFVFGLDTDSEQWQLADDLLRRAGLGDLLEQAREEIVTGAAGDDVPLDSLTGGEIGVVITDEVFEALAESDATDLIDADPTDDAVEATPTDPAGPPPATGAAFVLEAPNAPDTAFAAVRSGLLEGDDEENGEVLETEYEGVTIEYVVAEPGSDGDSAAVARIDDLILLAPSPVDLEPLIDTGQGNTAPLTDSDGFAEVLSSLDDESLLFGFVNGPAALEAQGSLPDELNPLAGLQDPSRNNGYSGILIRADEPGFRMETILVPAEGATLAPAAEAFESELLTQTPGDALFFLSAAELGQTGVLDALGALVVGLALGDFDDTAATPVPEQTAEEAIAAQYEEVEGLIGVNLQTDLLLQLNDEYGLWISSDADPSSITALFASGVEDPGTVVNALSQLTNLVQGGAGGEINVTTRQVEGAEVNVIDLGPGIGNIEYGVVDGRLVLGFNDAVDVVVDGPAESLADNAQFQEVFDTLPAERNGTIYVDLSQIIPLVQGLLEAPDIGGGDEIEDASPACADYDSADDAQAAYDAGEEGTFDLDQDFDGEACDDFFATATPEADVATPLAEAASSVDLSAIRAFALAAYDEDGNRRTSSILYIAEEGDEEAEATPAA